MSWWTPKFAQGVNTVDRFLANEGGWADGDCCRYYQGGVQPIGGWQQRSDSFSAIARAGIAWRTLDAIKAFAWGTTSSLLVELDGTRQDLAPIMHQTVLQDAVSSENGSNVYTVYYPGHRLSPGDEFSLSNPTDQVGGQDIDFDGEVNTVPTPDSFTYINTHGSASSTEPNAGGYVDFRAALPASITTWSLATWGENLLANPSGFGIFEYQPELAYDELVFNGTPTSADGWAFGTDWSYGGGVFAGTSGTGSNLSQNVQGVLEGGRVYVIEALVTSIDGVTKFRINAGSTPAVIDVGAASSPITGTMQISRIFICPADPVDIVFEKDADADVLVSNVSIKLVSWAYRLETAPARVDAMFVDPAGLVVALGTTDTDGNYSATLYRCSDLGNNKAWVPDTDSMASQQPLRGIGGRLMAGINTAEQNIVGGDEGVISLQYQGVAGEAFKPVLLGLGCGFVSRHCMCAVNGIVFWISNTRQFFIFQGTGIQSLGKPLPIGCPIQNEVFDNIDHDNEEKIHAGLNLAFQEAWFFYPDARDGTDECSRVATVAWTETDQNGAVPWIIHEIARSAWVMSGTFQYATGFGLSIGGNDPLMYDHEKGVLGDTDPMGWELTSASFDVQDGQFLATIDELIAQFSEQAGDIDITILHRDEPRDAWTETALDTLTPTNAYLYPEIKAREFAIRFAEGSDGATFRMAPGNLRLDLTPTQATH